MFDKFKKKKQKIQEKDDFFKDEEIEEKEEIPIEEGVLKEKLAEDLRAFKDDFREKKESLSQAKEEIINEENGEEEENGEVKEKWAIKENETDWLTKDYEDGELAVDVYQDKNNIYVKSTIAGVNLEDIDITLHNDMLTIRGKREREKEKEGIDYFYQECFWGSFSRSIILPVEVKADKVEAYLKEGVLTIILPKVKSIKGAKIRVKEK